MSTQDQGFATKQRRWVAAMAVVAVATLFPLSAAWSANTGAGDPLSNLDASAHDVGETTNGWSSIPEATG